MQPIVKKIVAADERQAGSRRAGDADARIGQHLRKARAARGLSQERLAELVGVSCQQLQKYETGANRIAAARVIELADALGVSVSVVLQGTACEALGACQPHPGPTSDEIMHLLTEFCRITRADSRKQIADMATFLANLK